jgi:hypothetical protein
MLPSRRQFLRGALGTAVALPLLSTLGGGRARAVPPSFPKRLVIFYSPHGTVKKDWIVNGSGSDVALAGILAPLEPHKKDLLLLKNVDMLSAEYGPGDPHQEGMGALLTGTACLADPLGSGGKRMDTGDPVGWGGGISVDQFIARGAGAVTRFPSLELGVLSDFNQVGGRIVYLGANQPVAPIDDPAVVFDRAFEGLGADPAGLARLRADRKSVLDAVSKQFARLSAKVGKEDRDKLGAHAQAIRDLELRLSAPGATLGASCRAPTRPDVDRSSVSKYPEVGKLQMDLLIMALACDLTRVGSIMWSHAGPTPGSPWLGFNDGHHALSHMGESDLDAQTKLSRLKAWYAEQLAYLVATMKTIPEGDGTMLDNTVIWWCSELSVGPTHSHRDMPFVLAGGAGGYFRTGRLVDLGRDAANKGRTHNDLLVSLCHAMGRTEVKTFGDPAYCSGGPMPGLTA